MTVQTDVVYPVWSFGDRIRKARTLADMNQREFAAAIEVAEGSLAAWETDRAIPRDIVTVAKRVELLTRIPAAWLLGVSTPGPFNGGSSQPDG
ncbi:helix-turn-helix domain-containing protein [Mycobacterium avium]|uniref:helix-turn-helix domain-containing protein n=1 Tax=Mycobacterium avium TaxID=1764 RepID=UPI001024700F|nr:helix-turn-helix transcriptional regulator [Mycobacterium avium]QBC87349.1 XRE family transcriptional regulator [Mycobacterium avium subsp. hominissuis]